MPDLPPPPFETIGDGALEARIVSWVLGDASAFEAAELERLCEERPELLVFRRRMRALHGLLTETEAEQPDDGWKLPEEKRRALDAIFDEPSPQPVTTSPKLRPVRRGRNALLAIAACLTLSTVTWLCLPKKYEAVAVIEIRPRSSEPAPFGRPQFFAAETEKIKSRNSLKQVTDRLNLTQRWSVDQDTAIQRLDQIVSTANTPGTNLIEIRARHEDKQLAAEIASEAAKGYRDYRRETDARFADQSLLELAKAVRNQKDKVEERRKVLSTIVRTKDIIYTGEDSFYRNGLEDDLGANSAVQAYNQLEQEKLQLESQIQSLLKFDSDQLLNYAAGLDLPENIIRTLQPEYMEAKRMVDTLKTQGLGDTHPTVQAQVQNVENMKRQLDEGVVNLRETLQAQLDLASARLARVEVTDERRVDAIQRSLDAQDYTDAKREFESAQALLQEMERKLVAEEITDKMPDESIVIHQDPTPESARSTRSLTDLTSRWFGRSESKLSADLAINESPAPQRESAARFASIEEARVNPAAPQSPPPAAEIAPGIPLTPAEPEPTIASANRSGDGTITRNEIDGILNNPTPATGAILGGQINGGLKADLSQLQDQPTPNPTDFGDGDDFGAGWGEADGAPPPSPAAGPAKPASPLPSLAQRENLRREAQTADEFSELDKATPPPAKPQSAQQPPSEPDALAIAGKAINQPTPPTDPVRDRILKEAENIWDSTLPEAKAKAGEFVTKAEELRNVGKYDEAREELTKALEADPTNEAAQNSLADLDDPIRSNPALTNENLETVDQVQRNLDLAEGELNLGQLDDAKKQYEETLRIDPNNEAARKGLERVATAQSNSDRAAYDQTHAELLTEVDAKWELTVPSTFDFSNELTAAKEPYSTFSLHISDASFVQAQAALEKGERPDPSIIKPEQFYNAIDCGDPSPSNNEPVAGHIEQSAHPVIPGRNLVRLSVKTAAAGRSAAQPLRLTLLIDESGSMARDDRRAAMDSALNQLAGLLTPNDKISVIGFSRTPRLLADGWTGDKAPDLKGLVNLAASEAGTNLEQAINLADQLAKRHLTPGAQNRIILFTDGAANLGDADPARLAERVKALRQQGIAFDVAGISADDLNDQLLSELTRHGNGRYQIVDGGDAGNRFANQLAGAFRPAAENVKVQIRFNSERVVSYRLNGFEEHRLNTEDFRNDAVDAAELASEEAGTALYQVQTNPQGSGEIGEMSVRFRDTATGEMVERTWTIPYDPATPAFDQATPSLQLSGLALLSAEKLKGGPLADAIRFQDFTQVRAKLKQYYAQNPRAQQVLRMTEQLQ
jgi:tetratricopeptide (TPR) repeat protein